MIDYSIYYRRSIETSRISMELPKFDLFVSAFNSSDRLRTVFLDVKADQKIWLIHPEYAYSPLDEPVGFPKINPAAIDEAVQVNALIGQMGGLSNKSICVDITGFMRHALIFLVEKFARIGVRKFTALYSEPMFYTKQENTAFSTTTTGIVRPVRGMSGSNTLQAKDYLVVGVGYDHKLISEVANYKDSAQVYPVFGFPSLSPDMYQQSAIRASESGDITLGREWVTNRRFAPANDPFSTAAVVRDIVKEIDKKKGPANIYLSPLSTKAQVLGFALYYHLEGLARGGITMLTPECSTYSRETTSGLKRLWAYTIEL